MKKNKFKKNLSVVIAGISCASAIGTVALTSNVKAENNVTATKSFDDVLDTKMFFYNPVYWAARNKITTGFNDNTFRPDDTCTRGQAVTFLWRHEGEPNLGVERYFDDTHHSAFKDSISWAAGAGVTTGFNDGTFKQDNPCTRGQIVTFIWRDAGKPEVESSNSFSDVSETSVFVDAINWAASEGITTGFEDDTFRQDDPCTRAQIVTFLYRWNSTKEKNNAETASTQETKNTQKSETTTTKEIKPTTVSEEPTSSTTNSFILPTETRYGKTYTFTTSDGLGNKNTYTFKKGEKVVIPEPTREGYTFLGWNRHLNYIADGEEIYAVWKKNEEETTPHQHVWKTVHHDTETHEETYTVKEPYTYEVAIIGCEVYVVSAGENTPYKKGDILYQSTDEKDVAAHAFDYLYSCWMKNYYEYNETDTVTLEEFLSCHVTPAWRTGAIIGYETKTGYEDVQKTRTVIDKEAYDEEICSVCGIHK